MQVFLSFCRRLMKIYKNTHVTSSLKDKVRYVRIQVILCFINLNHESWMLIWWLLESLLFCNCVWKSLVYLFSMKPRACQRILLIIAFDVLEQNIDHLRRHLYMDILLWNSKLIFSVNHLNDVIAFIKPIFHDNIFT